MLVALTAFFAGIAHVFTGPDHLAALAPLALRKPGGAVRTAFRWGLGHALGVLVVGGVALLVRSSIDVGRVSHFAEAVVGVTLVAIGAWAFFQGRRVTVHAHDHGHAGHDDHQHLHVHAPGVDHGDPTAHANHTHAALGVGMLHGAAGTGHVMGVLPVLALSESAAVIWLVSYMVGAVLGMVGFGAFLGSMARRMSGIGLRRVMMGSGVLAAIIGVVWLGIALPTGA